MPRSHRNYVPYFDQNYEYGDDTPVFKAGCRGLLMLSSGAVVIIILGLPFWTAYQIGRGAFGQRGWLMKAFSLLVSFVAFSLATMVFVVDGTSLLQIVIAHSESQFPTWMTIALMFSFVYLTSMGLSYFIGYLKRTRFVLG